MDLVTGATGIVGIHALLELLRAGRPVRALYRKGSDRSAVDQVFGHYGGAELARRIEWAEGDLLDVLSLAGAMRGVERVFHAAALVSFDPARSRALHTVNAVGTANLVNMALEAGVRRFCHVSSAAAIGSAPPGTVRDERLDWSDDDVSSGYARSKHLAELEVQRGIAEGLDAVIVNPAVVIGPGPGARSSMSLVRRLQRGTRWFPRGSNGFVDARDVAACMLGLMERGQCGERYLLVGRNAAYRELFSLFSQGFGHAPPMHEAKPWMLGIAWRATALHALITGAEPMVTRATVASAIGQRSYSNAKGRELLGYRFRSLEESVANAVSFARAFP